MSSHPSLPGGISAQSSSAPSDRERAEAALRFNETMLKASPVGIVTYKSTGEAVSANRAIAEMTGGTVEQLSHQNFRQLESWKKNGMLEAAEKALATGQEQQIEAFIHTSFGTELWLSCRFVPFDYEGELHLLGLFSDSSERKRSEQALRESQYFLQKAQAVGQVGSWVSDPSSDGGLIWSDEACRIFGFKPEEFDGRVPTFFKHVHPDDLDAVNAAAQASMNDGRPYDIIHRIIRPDGIVRWVHQQGDVDRDEQGQALRMIGVVRDITTQKEAETSIQKLAAFPRYNPNPVFEFSPTGELSYCNDAANQMAQSLGQPQAVNILPVQTKEIVKKCLETGLPRWRLEVPYGQRTISWSFFPIHSSQVVHCYAADISQRMLLEAQLRQSQKMESIGQLAGGMAHDFNNLLTVIQGHASMLLIDRRLPQHTIDTAKEIDQAAERAAKLTRQLLTFSRKQVMQLKNLDVNDVITNLTRMLHRLLGENIKLDLDLKNQMPFVNADGGMLEQVLVNLTVNSRDAMPKGGRLTVRTTTEELDENYLRTNPDAKKGLHVRISVTDTGCGIPVENLPRVFEPFFTTKDVGTGTGLGLATVYGIVQQHQGWIRVNSVVNEGTTFDIYLPTSVKPAAGSDTDFLQRTAVGGTETILLVEDENAVRFLVRSILEHYGYTVFEAEHGPAALEVWKQHRYKIKLLLTDMMMPEGMTGHDLAERLLAEEPALKVIYTSGYSANVFSKDAPLRPDIAFLQKPYQPHKLARLVRDTLDGTLA
ncbi:MAG TPA: PAS domain-containing protein [Verrucomicrobiae bacterium]